VAPSEHIHGLEPCHIRLCTDPGTDTGLLPTIYNLKMKTKYFKTTKKWDSSQQFQISQLQIPASKQVTPSFFYSQWRETGIFTCQHIGSDLAMPCFFLSTKGQVKMSCSTDTCI